MIYTDVAHGSEGWLLGTISRESGRPLLYVATSDREMDLLARQMEYFASNAITMCFPAWDCLPYDRVSPKAQLVAERLATLATLASPPPGKRLIVITTINAITQKLPPRRLITSSTLRLSQGDELNREKLMQFLTANGYLRVSKAMEPGEFSLRGSIIDLFPNGYSLGCRIDLFGDEIESIQSFDPLTQRSTGESISQIDLHPVSELLMSSESIERFRSGYRQAFGAVSKSDPLYEAASHGRHYPGVEHWLPLFYDSLDTLFDYLPADTVTLFAHQTDQILKDRKETIEDYYQARANAPKSIQADTPYNPLEPQKLYLLGREWDKQLQRQEIITFTPFTDTGGTNETPSLSQHIQKGRDFAPERKQGQNPFELAHTHIRTLLDKGLSITIACISEGSRQRVEEKLFEQGALPSSKVEFIALPLPHGFVTSHEAYISEQDILGERLSQTTRKRRRTDQFMAEAANFSEGELIVHKEHGIGRFEGLVTMEVQNIAHDCLKLVYADDDKLFLPVENIDLISRYGSGDEIGDTQLDKLGSAHWQSRKAKMKERIKIAAEELLKIAAKRELAKAPILTPPDGLYEEFCNRFPYVETEDQDKAIHDVLDDLSKGCPADRLICGDVGFGKTEVALRAAFVAATSGGAQVAVIAPTTLLARQHYQNFIARFDGFPVTIRMLSRLVSSKDKKETLEGLETGKVDIVIGTHALLSEGVSFKNLAVLIVDEEQHFGVKQKEKLKKLRSNIHVFTLSATPIPRTLQLALAGVRELSLITTPPIDRLAVRTFVTPFDSVVIREALLREYHRGGQSFYVTPYISDMAELQVKLRDIAPEMKIAVANGQMPAGELDSIMNDFYDGKYDILLSTAIIESGIDVPNANTMIINRADRFGLSQLYQLRGRVGRSKRRAYAYLTLPHGRHFTDTAMRRLEVMQTLDTLGAGFSVASHDMDIRGFGNLVGEEQSGHVREVGVELYQQMLEDAVNAARKSSTVKETESTLHEWQPQIALGVSVLIPESYVQDLDLRLALYRRAGQFHHEDEIEAFTAELIDRFGTLPDEAKHFLTTLRLKLTCYQTGIERLDVGPKGMVITFRNNKVARPEGLVDFISNPVNKAKLRSDQKLVIQFPEEAFEKRMARVQKTLSELNSLLRVTQKAA